MEKKVCVIVICVLLVLILQSSKPHASRLLLSHDEEMKHKKGSVWTIQRGSSSIINEEFSNLMGEEECDEEEEECVKRRMIAEAHLDYIYTQHHNP